MLSCWRCTTRALPLISTPPPHCAEFALPTRFCYVLADGCYADSNKGVNATLRCAHRFKTDW